MCLLGRHTQVVSTADLIWAAYRGSVYKNPDKVEAKVTLKPSSTRIFKIPSALRDPESLLGCGRTSST